MTCGFLRGCVTWWTIGMLMLTNIFTIYIYFSHTLAGVITTSFTLSYLLSNPLQPCPIVCVSLQIITKVLTLICQMVFVALLPLKCITSAETQPPQ